MQTTESKIVKLIHAVWNQGLGAGEALIEYTAMQQKIQALEEKLRDANN